MTINDEAPGPIERTKRKLRTPYKSLSRSFLSASVHRSSPSFSSQNDTVPGVMIKFVGEMTQIDNVPTFSLRILHEQHGISHPSFHRSSPSNVSSPLYRPNGISSIVSQKQQKSGQLLLKLPSNNRFSCSNSSSALRRHHRTHSYGSSYPRELEESLHENYYHDSGHHRKDKVEDLDDETSEDRFDQFTVPERGRRRAHGNGSTSVSTTLNAKKSCSSCGTKKTPYWREGWEPSIILCNACGIRYQKYKKFCTKCVSIARKDDKGRLHCPECLQRL